MTRGYLLLALAVAGCGASTLDVHGRAALASLQVLELAHNTIRQDRARRVAEAIRTAPDRESAEDARDTIDLELEPVVDAYETVRAAHSAWVRIIDVAYRGGDFDIVAAIAAAGELVTLYSELSRIATHLGLNLPQDLADLVNAALAASESP